MATHSSTLAWKIPWMEEPGGLQSMESLRVGHDWVTSLSLFTFMHWRGKWQPTPVFLPGESQGRGSLVSCRLWGRTESDIEATQQQQQQQQQQQGRELHMVTPTGRIQHYTLALLDTKYPRKKKWGKGLQCPAKSVIRESSFDLSNPREYTWGKSQ